MAFYETSNSVLESQTIQGTASQGTTSQQTQQTQQTKPNWVDVGRGELAQYLTMQGRIKQLITLAGFNWMNEGQRRQAANEQAESEWYRRQLGLEAKSNDGTDEFDMKNVNLGDTIHPTPIVIAPPAPLPPSNNLQNLLIAGLSTGMAGVIGYLVAGGNQQASPVPQPVTQSQEVIPTPQAVGVPSFEYEAVQVGLGQYEDYFPQGKDKDK